MRLHMDGSLDGLDVWGRPDDVADDESFLWRKRREKDRTRGKQVSHRPKRT